MIQLLTTRSGIPYSVLGDKPERPAPTLFIFSRTAHESLTDPYYRQCGGILATQGYVCVSVDLPCHGAERIAGEPDELAGWRVRIDQQDDLIATLNQKLTAILDDLIVKGYTDAGRVAACGVSRGGFVALHFAAADKRVRAVAAFAPVTDLAALTEFKGAENQPLVRQLALTTIADKLAGRPVWIVIGDQDQRVGTARATAFAKRLSQTATSQGLLDRLVFNIVSGSPGHTTPPGSFEKAAAWMIAQ